MQDAVLQLVVMFPLMSVGYDGILSVFDDRLEVSYFVECASE